MKQLLAHHLCLKGYYTNCYNPFVCKMLSLILESLLSYYEEFVVVGFEIFVCKVKFKAFCRKIRQFSD